MSFVRSCHPCRTESKTKACLFNEVAVCVALGVALSYGLQVEFCPIPEVANLTMMLNFLNWSQKASFGDLPLHFIS